MAVRRPFQSSFTELQKTPAQIAQCPNCKSSVFLNVIRKDSVNKGKTYFNCNSCQLFMINDLQRDFPQTNIALKSNSVPQKDDNPDFKTYRQLYSKCCKCMNEFKIYKFKKGENVNKYGGKCEYCDAWYIDQNATNEIDIQGVFVKYVKVDTINQPADASKVLDKLIINNLKK